MSDIGDGGRIFVNGEELSKPATRAAGGGPKHHPQTLEQARETLMPQLKSVHATLTAIPERLRAERVVIEAEVFANYLANSYFPADLVKQLELRPLGSRVVEHGVHDVPSRGQTEAITKSFLLSADAKAVSGMQAILEGRGGSKGAADELRQFTKISVSEAHRALAADSDGLVPYEAVLHPDPDASTIDERAAASDATLSKFTELVESVGGRVHSGDSDVVDGLTFVSLQIPGNRVGEVASFNPLRSLAPTPKMVLMDDAGDDDDAQSSTLAPAASVGLPEVLVFDGGVNDAAPIFAGNVTSTDLTGSGLSAGDLYHGSAVTAAILYGDLGNASSVPEPAAHVTHFQIVPGPGEDAAEFAWTLRQIRQETLTTHARIVNLSLGPLAPVEDREPHRWTAVLDKIAYERQILFVSAAGNNGAADAATGLNRVQSPADMVNGLSVGACDKPAPETQWNVTDYSGRGPGRPGARIQPALVAFGGTPQRRFGRVRADGRVVHDHEGTSYAAPLVTNVLARLSTQLGGRSDANTLRALAVHFAQNEVGHPLSDVGHGRLPADVESLLRNSANEATVIYQGVLNRDETRAYPLPVPSTLQKGNVSIRWSLALSTETDTAEAGEYSKAGLEVKFRPHDEHFSIRRARVNASDEVKTVTISSAAERARYESLGWTVSQNPVTATPKTSTRTDENSQRELGKWESLWRAEKTMRASSLRNPRIDINHLTREGGRITTGTDPVQFSLVVTVTARPGTSIYAAVQTEFPVLTALPIVVPVMVDVDEINVPIA